MNALELTLDDADLAGAVEEISIDNRPVHRVERIIDTQRELLKESTESRITLEADKDRRLKMVDSDYEARLATIESRLASLTKMMETLGEEKNLLSIQHQERRKEIKNAFDEDDAALVKIINAQRLILTELEKKS